MSYAFSEYGCRGLRDLMSGGALLCFDFDGTLAPIVSDPRNAGMAAEVERQLRRLSEVAPVAVLSGRSLPDLKSRFSFGVKYMVGNHGLEGLPGATPVDQVRESCELWKQILKADLSDVVDHGVWVEDKGWSLSIHYRNLPAAWDQAGIEDRIRRCVYGIGERSRVIPGKLVFNLVPEGAIHKGTALVRLMARSNASSALFVGDDETDEDVFALRDPRIVGVRVGKSHSSAAPFYLQDQEEVAVLLERLLQYM